MADQYSGLPSFQNSYGNNQIVKEKQNTKNETHLTQTESKVTSESGF
jgi:hypothetical protein